MTTPVSLVASSYSCMESLDGRGFGYGACNGRTQAWLPAWIASHGLPSGGV